MRLFKYWIPALLLAGAAVTPLVGAENTAKHSEADYQVAYMALEAMQLSRSLRQTLSSTLEMQLKSNPQLLPVRDVLESFLTKYLNYENLKQRYADLYLDVFTAEELKEMIAFYQTPLGRKIVSKGPELTVRAMKIGQNIVLEHSSELQEALAKAISERRRGKQSPLESKSGTMPRTSTPAASRSELR